VNDDKIKSSQDTANAKGSESQTEPELFFNNAKKTEPYNQETGYEQNAAYYGKNIILPVRLWHSLYHWWTNPKRQKANVPERITVVITIVLAVIGGL
jgi:hypothetical protein